MGMDCVIGKTVASTNARQQKSVNPEAIALFPTDRRRQHFYVHQNEKEALCFQCRKTPTPSSLKRESVTTHTSPAASGVISPSVTRRSECVTRFVYIKHSVFVFVVVPDVKSWCQNTATHPERRDKSNVLFAVKYPLLSGVVKGGDFFPSLSFSLIHIHTSSTTEAPVFV